MNPEDLEVGDLVYRDGVPWQVIRNDHLQREIVLRRPENPERERRVTWAQFRQMGYLRR